jgi:hydroxyacylglutathione hydrolase
MIVRRFYDDNLAQASYLIGCAATGDALVVDPNRDVEQYLRAAADEGVRVSAVTETHIHADFVSGSRELAARSGAALYLSREGGADWQYAFAAEAGAVLVGEGDSFRVGNVRIDVLHTPGHTPEHLSFLVTDTAAADRPIAALTGDFLFVGDVGRPDLLERAAGVSGTMESGARDLFRSLRRFLAEQPEWLQVWPGHGAGSACGKGLSAVPHSTVGYERLYNRALSVDDEDAFVRAVLEGQPEPPGYFAEMKRINRDGPPLLGGVRRPPREEAGALARVLEGGGVVVDTRPAAEFAAAHVPGTVNIPLDRAFTTWAGWLIPYDRPFHLLVGRGEGDTVDRAVRDLAMIGLDRVEGWFSACVLDAWTAEGGALQRVPQVGAAELAERMEAGTARVLDVRGAAEWEAGRIPGVPNLPLGYLRDRLHELPREGTLVVQCQGGARSSIAAGLLQAAGVADVVNLEGGFDAWRRAGLPVERGAAASAAV